MSWLNDALGKVREPRPYFLRSWYVHASVCRIGAEGGLLQSSKPCTLLTLYRLQQGSQQVIVSIFSPFLLSSPYISFGLQLGGAGPILGDVQGVQGDRKEYSITLVQGSYGPYIVLL